MRKLIGTSVIMLLGALAFAAGCSQQPPQGPRGQHGPPQEAIDACKGLAENAACSVKMGEQTHEGKCAKGRDEAGELACMPEGGHGGPPGGPPPDGKGPPPARQ